MATDINSIQNKKELLKLETIVQESNNAIIGETLEGIVTSWNGGATKMFGYAPEEVVGRSMVNIFLPENKGELSQILEKIRDGEAVIKYETVLIRKDGTHVDVEFSVSPIHSGVFKKIIGVNFSGSNINDKKVLSAATIINDISDKKKQEESSLKLRNAVNSSSEAIFMTDCEGTITFVNQGFTKLYGYTVDEVVDRVTPRILKSGFTKLEEVKAFWKTIMSKEVFLGEHFNKTKNNRLITVYGSVNAILNEEGDIVGFLAVQHDVTERKKTEESLFRLADAVNSSSEAIFMTDREGIITFINPGFTKLYGYTTDEVIGRVTPRILKSGMRSLEKVKLFWEAVLNKQVVVDEHVNKTKDGRLVAVRETTSTILNEKGDIIGFLAFQYNASKEYELEKAKMDFLSLASHQLRTPLSAIKWVLEDLEEPRNNNNLTIKQKDRFNDLKISNERLINLIDRLLNITRIESGKLKVKKELVDFKKLIEDTSASLKILADKNKKNIKVTIPSNLESVFCDPVLIREALENLIKNAIDYSTVDSKDIGVSVEDRADDYLVSIHNEGVIDLVTLEKINKFDKFTRGDNSSQPSGSGLGLYISKKVIEANGGSFWLQSDVESGTTFYFTIAKNKSDKKLLSGDNS